jgi:acetate kinase
VRVLTVNAGSTSLKLAAVVDGDVETTPDSLDAALAGDPPDCVAHRVVHGGSRAAASLVNDEVVDQLAGLTALAPLHQPPALAAIASCRARWPQTPNVACFDTAFHATVPAEARTYALPARFRNEVRAYGFHGLSYAWATMRVHALAPDSRRVLLAHLGGGQSLCGTRDGRSAITTMGFTPLDGLVMGTRCGALDPGAVLWLAARVRDEGADGDMARVLDEESGLLGLCGTSDMRVLHERAAAGDEAARLAFAVWRHRLVTLAGACIAALGGLDGLVFTGGIGEHDPTARAALVDGLAWLGVRAAERPSATGDRELTVAGSSARVFVITAREDLQLAAEATACLEGA